MPSWPAEVAKDSRRLRRAGRSFVPPHGPPRCHDDVTTHRKVAVQTRRTASDSNGPPSTDTASQGRYCSSSGSTPWTAIDRHGWARAAYGSESWEFESLRARYQKRWLPVPTAVALPSPPHDSGRLGELCLRTPHRHRGKPRRHLKLGGRCTVGLGGSRPPIPRGQAIAR
jgi:hypothetical protein